MKRRAVERSLEANNRQNTFDFMRLVAALAVVVEHSVRHLDTQFLWHTPHDNFWFNGGVATFFILSGMMVYKSAQRCHAEGRPWFDFYQNRALRIMPAIYAYFVILVVLLLATGFIAPNQLVTVQFAAFAASNLFLIPVWSPPMLDEFGIGVVNGSLWTIPVEVSFYLIVPLIVLLAARKGARTMALTLLATAGVGVALYVAFGLGSEVIAWKLYGVSFLPHLWWFALGILGGLIWSKLPQRGWLAAIAVVVYFVFAKLPLEPGAAFVANAVAAIPLAYAAIWFGYNGPKVLSRFTARIGDLSFSVYIWHMIVVNLLVSWGARDWSVPGTLLIFGVVVACMLVASASWWLVERPALTRKRYTSTTAVARINETEPPVRPKRSRG